MKSNNPLFVDDYNKSMNFHNKSWELHTRSTSIIPGTVNVGNLTDELDILASDCLIMIKVALAIINFRSNIKEMNS